MTWRFRKSFAPLPGVRVTLSKRGITTSVGAGPVRLSAGPRGAALAVNVPGLGVSFRQPLKTASSAEPKRQSALSESSGIDSPAWSPEPIAPPDPMPTLHGTPAMDAIQSGSSSMMTSPGLAAFKASLMGAEALYAATEKELVEARSVEQSLVGHYESWNRGWFLKRVAKKRFRELRDAAEEGTSRRAELDEQLQLSRLSTQFEMSDGVAKAFEELCRAFSTCSCSQRIWDNVAHRATNRVVERTTASRIVDLKPVKFRLGKCSVIDAPMAVPHLENANGGDIFLFPGFILYHAASTNYALVEFGDFELKVFASRFHEEGPVPSDAEQVGTTWARANKDGSPDKRFRDNYSIPVMRYATLTLRSSSGLNEEYMLSNVQSASDFETAFARLRTEVAAGE